MRGGPRRSGLLLDLFACFLIPAYTLLFAGSRAWFSTNFSVIAVTGPDHYRGFLYWGVLAGGYFFLMLMPPFCAAVWLKPPPFCSPWPPACPFAML